jgi:6-phosphogluconolactonase
MAGSPSRDAARRPDAGGNRDLAGGDSGGAAAGNPFVYVSTGNFGGNHLNIYQLNMQTGALMARGMAATGPGPTYGAFHPGGRFMYVLNEGGSRIEAFSINRETGALTKLNDASSGGNGPAHLSVHKSGKWVLSSNYGSGHAAALPIMADGRVGPPVAPQVAGAEAHMILDDGITGKFVFVPSKGTNRVLQYRFDETTGQLQPNTPPFVAQAGQPRHMAFHRSGLYAYLLTEGGRTLTSYKYDSATGLLSDGQTMPAAPGGNGAHIAVHPTKEFLYVSIRAENSIGVFSIGADGRPTLVTHVKDGVSNPWDFAIDPTGTFLLVANDGNSTVRVFRIDQSSGMLTGVGGAVSIGSQPHFVGVLP